MLADHRWEVGRRAIERICLLGPVTFLDKTQREWIQGIHMYFILSGHCDDISTSPATATGATGTITEEDQDEEGTIENNDYASSMDDHSVRRNGGGGARYRTLACSAAQDDKVVRYRDRILTRSIVFAFALAFVLLVVAGIQYGDSS
ncbi:hypothetical protein F4779DRAFT_622515 [Xylariaceae sp. FL0662B]|nr:hypothetical protein F4779DRAFT_622515 [Xylariaceae sp. FL0662B]